MMGRTVDTVIAAMEANHPDLTNQKTLYVEISRARDRAELLTDDAKDPVRAVGSRDGGVYSGTGGVRSGQGRELRGGEADRNATFG